MKAVSDMIDDLVNLDIFERPASDRPTNLMFRTDAHSRLFAILLADFLAQPKPKAFRFAFPVEAEGVAARETDRTYLFLLAAMCRQPQFGGDVSALATATADFADWLDGECHCPDVWLPELDLSLDLKVSRLWLLKVVGDASKHNFSRLEVRVKAIQTMLRNHGHEVEMGMVYRALPNFHDWFYSHLFAYHASAIGAFLDAIRRALHAYLKPEYARAWRRGDRFDGDYSFDVPATIRDPLATGLYWELMNRVRGGLSFPPFILSPSFRELF
nr:hypothetical protein [uncultured Brevundimonas sp.]